MTYDLAGRRVRMADGNNHLVSFLFDALNRDAGSIDPLARRVTMAYDPVNNLTVKQSPRGFRVTSTFDALNRKLTDKFTVGSPNTFVYDPVGNQLVVSNGVGRYTQSFDPSNRTSVVQLFIGKRLTYGYDPADRRTKMTDQDGGRFTYVFDGAWQLKVVLNPQGKRTTFTRDPLYRVVQQVHGNTALTTHLFDPAGREIGTKDAESVGVLLYRSTQTYDANGRKVGLIGSDGGRVSWTYDPSGQLTREWRTGPGAYTTTYTYDKAGNSTVQNDSNTRTTYLYDAANQVTYQQTGSARTTYTWDGAGNRASIDTPSALTVYSWDELNRLTQVEPVGGPVTMTYDAWGRRTLKKTTSEDIQYLYDFERLLAETDGSGTTDREYTQTTEQYGDLLSAYGGGASKYYAQDALGSTELLLNDSQTASDAWRYRAFGLASQYQGTDTEPMQFVGKLGYYTDAETGLILARGRYYDPVLRRWFNEDPFGYRGGDPNLYRYCFNDPLNEVDPSGNSILVSNCPNLVDRAPKEFRDAIFNIFAPWGDVWRNKDDVNFDLGANLSINGQNYRELDVYDSLPPGVLGIIQEKGGSKVYVPDLTGSGVGPALVNSNQIRIKEGLENGAAFDKVLLGGPFPVFIDPPREAPKSWGSQIWEWIESFGGKVVQGLQWIAEQTCKLGKVGLVKIAQAAGISGDQLKKLEDFADYFCDLAAKGATIVKSYFDGAKQGVAKFCTGKSSTDFTGCPEFPNRLLDALGKAINVNNLSGIVTKVEGGQAVSAILDVLDLTADNLLSILSSVLAEYLKGDLGSVIASQIISVVNNALNKSSSDNPMDNGLAGLLIDLTNDPASLFEKFPDLTGIQWNLSDITGAIEKELPGALKSLSGEIQSIVLVKVAEAIALLVLKFVPGAGVVASLKSLYDLVDFFLKQINDPESGIKTLWTSLKNSFGAAVQGRVEVVGDAVNTSIQSALETVIGALLKVLVSADLGKLVDTAKSKTSGIVTAVARSILGVVGKPIETVLGKVFPADALSGASAIPGKKLTRAVASKDGKTKAWLQVDNGNIVVVVSQSPPVNITESKQPEIQSDLNSLKKDGADLKKKIEDQAKQPAMKPVSTMKVSTKQAQMMATQNARNQVKPVVEQTKKVEAELQKLADDYKGGCAVPGVAPKSNMCFVMGTLLALANGSRVPIEQVRLGQRVSTWKDSELGYRELFTNLDTLIDPTQYRAIWFHLEDEFGNRVEFGMLKPLTWLWQENVSQVGDRAAFNLPEMGVVGLAQVMAIEPCPPIEAGPGRIVMSVFRHYRAAIWRLIVDNDVIEGTELHPFWSRERLAWVALRDLRTGERLSGENGPVSTRNIEDTGRIEPVFNLEVDADHCYRVGEQGILVHNNSVACDFCADMMFNYQSTPPSGSSWTNYVETKCSGSAKGVDNPHGHHIVMKGDRYPENAQARQILCKYGINPFTDCRNLVISRNFCHSDKYAKRVLSDLQKADTPGATASEIATVLMNLAAYHRICPDGGTVDPNTDDS